MSQVFVDTSAWIALVSRDDAYHGAAAGYYRDLRGPSLVTTNAVMYETYNWLAVHRQRRAVSVLRDRIEAAQAVGLLDVVAVNADLESTAFRIFDQFDDVVLTYTDCLSAAVARAAAVEAVFTFDDDFSVLGFATVPSYRRTR
ncbi:MAG: PIN domain-containing protein [Dehalococcoidia bacterium]|nr:PIN domain-containing protein [Dehalococcoidia bacterium]